MNDTIKRTSRNAESRDSNTRPKTWTLPSSWMHHSHRMASRTDGLEPMCKVLKIRQT